MKVEETYSILDTHYLTDKELAVLLSATKKPIEQCVELLKRSQGFIVISSEGKADANLLNACETGLQLREDDSWYITHTKSPSEFSSPDELLDAIDTIELSVDFECWVGSLIHHKFGANPKDAMAWFSLLRHYVESGQDRTDVVCGRKMRHPDATDFPLENLV